ncbi:MAG: hypothetical protein C0478_12305 [Planctomyces sp.]|nr:hypothetical protein [Planctomyces sp.]
MQVVTLIVVSLAGGGVVYGLLSLNGISAGTEVLVGTGLCLIPALLSVACNELFVVRRSLSPSGSSSPHQVAVEPVNAMVALVGMGLRMGFVGAGVLVLPKVVPDWQTRPFFYSVLVVYFLSLVTETGFLLAALKRKSSRPSSTPGSSSRPIRSSIPQAAGSSGSL